MGELINASVNLKNEALKGCCAVVSDPACASSLATKHALFLF